MNQLSNSDKWNCAIIYALLFLIISHPTMYRFTNSIVSGHSFILADGAGCPTALGMFVHMIVFLFATRLFMNICV
jgi:hypothetical protein